MRTAFSKVAYALKRAAQATLLLAVVTGCSTASTTIPAIAAGDRYAAIVIDANTGKTLFASNADAQRYPASLTKMMTLYMLFEAMQAGRMSKDTRIPVSAYAAARPPTKIGFRPGQSIRAEDAALAMITKSANDVATAVGEYLGGSEERFAQMMTAKARRLGMRNTTFRNASGLPNMAQHTTARDMAILSIALRQHFPNEFSYFSRRSFVFRGQTINGHNRLLGRVEGVDGIKTGYTNASGYNLASSVSLDGRRLVAVVMGGNTGASRDAHMAQLIRKYLPMATRSRNAAPLVAMRNDAPQVVASVDLPKAKNAPVPVTREAAAVEDFINNESGEGDSEQPQVLALAAPTARPAALAAQAAIRPTPKAAVPSAQAQDVDPVTTASAPAAGGWAIQIGSLPSEGQARDMLAKASATAGGTLRAASPYTETFSKGSATFYRARFVGFSSKQAAWDACASLKKKNFGCYAVAN
ncbi:serine hydrolase [Brucella sp. RRSP16]|uniref:D-alanyl-D-alanine carboxypeptidase/D-alanyl-D-alanine carboxypeptidase (Penicillin-binding protein 5/6) n=4 Tax=Brucella intermedia TaxID=94625 RepID=A0ABR6AJD9_9HYPH|nr:D-alanyl-D-alanine carboxypeptidase family protein [Brucella intermedia]MCH6204990.1 D-alanyl-D-alanine carboxypeptidase [Brucella ciceri]KAB2697046.1 D-alanyl-D-alanine carboxypeptidase [Brucella intermedia]KAB2708500.1 D-alanyl-D-alanine carboxypeptidase [Brucella intermedia]MBA8849593.1 D-alanyl-D-alanine carboxypeptidase/D-alanyl-D-alanine carboxypeptidase (penicillin-binding protein 5/6) [Brucella intermedia]MDH0122858.1 D-alanyl-D-alanine carboxypeptidase [Brucella intermedia GD04153]